MEIPKNAVGLIRGRHDMPVSRYIFEDVEKCPQYRSSSSSEEVRHEV